MSLRLPSPWRVAENTLPLALAVYTNHSLLRGEAPLQHAHLENQVVRAEQHAMLQRSEDRLRSIEAKGPGLAAVTAVVAAGLILAFAETWGSKGWLLDMLLIVAAVYTASSLWTPLKLVGPLARETVTNADLSRVAAAADPAAELARLQADKATRNNTQILRLANLQSASRLDLRNAVLVFALWGALALSDAAIRGEVRDVELGGLLSLETPIDLLGVLAGAIGGFALVTVVDWLRRPRVVKVDFRREPFKLGPLCRLGFELRGRPPGLCFLEIAWSAGSVFAKWDETPNPVSDGTFRPELVPSTFYLALFPGRRYSVPVVIDTEDGPEIFSGWWFGKPQYGPPPGLRNDEDLTLTLIGAGLRWSTQVSVADICTAADKSRD